MRFCSDCAYCTGGWAENATCHAPDNNEPSPVTGRNRRIYIECRNCRLDHRACGPDARWFQEKEQA